MRRISSLLLPLLLAGLVTAQAEVKKEQNTKVKFEGMMGRMMGMFGGAKASDEGLTSTIALKGDRKLTRTSDTGDLVDLAEEKIYQINFKDRSYKMQTFEQLRQQIREAQEKMAKEMDKMKGQQQPTSPQASNLEVEFNLKESGQKKMIAGFDTHEVVMTITMHEKGRKMEDAGGMGLVSNIWLTSKLPGSDELAEFDMKFYQKLALAVDPRQMQQMAMAMAANPMMGDMMKKFAEEGKKLNGTAVLTETRFEAMQSKEQMAQMGGGENKEPENPMGMMAKASPFGIMGGLAKKAMQKKAEEKAAETAAPSTPGPATIMTSTDQLVSISSNVSDADVAIPAGFKEKK